MRLLPYLLLLSSAALAQHHPAPASKEQAYYCASGRRVKYHRLSSCPGLDLCNADVKPLALGEAKRRMWPCKLCY